MNKASLLPKYIAVFALLLTVGVYIPALSENFFADDFVYIVGNNKLLTIPWTGIWKIFLTRTNNFEYLPVRDLSYWIDYSLFGLNHAAFIAHNIFLYVLSCAVIWPCSKTILKILDPDIADTNEKSTALNWMLASIVVLFAFHPAHVESVAWASGRKELLSGLFSLCCLWQFSAAITRDTVSPGKLALAVLFFLLALGSKVAILPLAGVMFLLVLVRFRNHSGWEFGKNLRITAIFLFVIFVISTLFLLIFIKTGGETGVAQDATQITFDDDPHPISLAMKIQGYLLGLSIFPIQPRLIYDVAKPGLLSYISTISGVLVFIAGASGLVAIIRKKWTVPAFFAVFFVLICLPYLQLFPFKTWSLASERFLFLAVLAPITCIAYFLNKPGSATSRIVVGVLGICYLSVTYGYTLEWRSSSSLWRVTAARSPESGIAQSQLIEYVLIPAGEFSQAIESAKKTKDPGSREILINFIHAREYLADGNMEMAQQHALNMQQLLNNNSQPTYYFLVGEIAEKRKDFRNAIKNYFLSGQRSRKPLEIKNSQSALTRVRANYKQELDSARALAKASPTNIAALGNLANLEMELYLHSEAADKYQTILETLPGQPIAHYNLGLISMREGRYKESADLIEKAFELGLKMPRVLNNLGKARRNSGELDLAGEAFQKAVDLEPKSCAYRINLLRTLIQKKDYNNARNTLTSINAIDCDQEYFSIIDVLRDKIGST